MSVRLLPLLAALLLALGLPGVARAALCTTSSQSLTFQASSSYAVQAQTIPQINGSAGLACNPPALSLLGANYARASVTSVNGFTLTTGPGGDSIPYLLSADAAGGFPYNGGATNDYFSGTLLSLLGIVGTSFTPPIYARLSAGPNVAAGTYTDTLTVNWSWKVCTVALCLGTETGTGTSTIIVTLVVSADCKIIAPDLNFNSAPLASQFATASSAVLTDCTKGSTYKISFTSGGSPTARPWRTMSDGNGHTLQYNIYLPDGATIWDQTNPQTSTVNASKGAGLITPAQSQPYKARINPAQTTPPAGHYTDTVSVVITF